MFLEHKEAVEITPAKVLKLSEAIRIGAKLRSQCTGRMFARGGSCALGAAYEAVFGYPGENVAEGAIKKIREHFSIPYFDLVTEVGIERNDAGWSREQIADWLEGQGY